jgi:glycosyltransferase involved in cell wall biosynthesis
MVPETPLELSLVIPTFNQRARTIRTVEEADRWLRTRLGQTTEIIVVDDGSTVRPVLEAGDLPAHVQLVRHAKNLGKGGAVRTGVAQARGAYVVFTDSDLPFSLEPLPTTLAWLRDGADIVIGDRLHPESDVTTDVGPLRKLSSVVYTWLVNHALGLDFADTQCGYKAYRADVAKALYGALEVTSFAFDAEVLLRAERAGYKIRRQPVRLVRSDDSSVSLGRHAPRMLVDVAQLYWRRRRQTL